jgi:hypothetical protein
MSRIHNTGCNLLSQYLSIFGSATLNFFDINICTVDAVEIVEGYGTHDASAKQKKAYWSEEDENKLTTVFQ